MKTAFKLGDLLDTRLKNLNEFLNSRIGVFIENGRSLSNPCTRLKERIIKKSKIDSDIKYIYIFKEGNNIKLQIKYDRMSWQYELRHRCLSLYFKGCDRKLYKIEYEIITSYEWHSEIEDKYLFKKSKRVRDIIKYLVDVKEHNPYICK